MKILDTNIILRYLLRDNIEQANVAKEAIESGATTLSEVIMEVIYVLHKHYMVPKTEICKSLLALSKGVHVAEQEVILYALKVFESHNLDYVDCLLVAKAVLRGEDIITFDKKIKKTIAILKSQKAN